MGPLFLTLDGIDGTGKSTQLDLLEAWLRAQGADVVRCVDPGGTPIGSELRAVLLEPGRTMSARCEALLFMASRAELVHSVIAPALAAGKVVLSDRFLLATVVYQGYGGHLDARALWSIGDFATDGIEPDLTLVLDLPIEAAMRRRGRAADRMEQRDRAYHERVRAGFLAEAARQPGRIRVIDAAGSIDEVQAALRAALHELVLSGRRACPGNA